jgi:hypothetical protein
MGTRGYRVYRHRGWYHVHYNHWDSYPSGTDNCSTVDTNDRILDSGLGVEVAGQIPRDSENYKRWLEALRQELDSQLEEMRGDDGPDGDHYGDYNYAITRKQPCNDLFIEWIYEIDLDNEVFHGMS